jgi:purine-binding chemotaxis protein CheW
MSIADIMETTQYLTFKLDGEVFAVDIAMVREVLDFTTITKVPRTPDFMRGVINLRGSVVPVVDLRLKFGMAKTERTVNTCIIITEVSVDGETVILGALADSVQEVIDLDPDHIEPAPKIGTKLRTEFIRGMGKQNDKFIILLDINRVFSTDELALVQNAEHEVSPTARNADAAQKKSDQHP